MQINSLQENLLFPLETIYEANALFLSLPAPAKTAYYLKDNKLGIEDKKALF